MVFIKNFSDVLENSNLECCSDKLIINKLKTDHFDMPFALGRQFIDQKNNLLFSMIPKNASSAIACAIVESSYPFILSQYTNFSEFQDNIHKYHGLLSAKSMATIRACETVRILRDPIRRIVSAFLNKFVVDIEDIIIDPICKFVHKEACDVTFEDFLRYLCCSPNYWLDPHFRPQTDFLIFDDYNYTFYLDDITQLSDFFHQKMGVFLKSVNYTSDRVVSKDYGVYCGDKKSGDFYLSNSDLNALPLWGNFLSGPNVECIKYRYKDDFYLLEQLGYFK